MIDISEQFLEPIQAEYGNWRRTGRRPTKLLLSLTEEERVLEMGFDQGFLLGMEIVHLNCIPPGRAMIVDDLNPNLALPHRQGCVTIVA